MLKDNRALKVPYEGSLNKFDEWLESGVERSLRTSLGLSKDDVSFAEGVKYHVTLQVPAEASSTSKRELTATSTVSLDDAVQQATLQGTLNYDPEKAQVEVERQVEVPYFTVPIVSRSLSREKLTEYHADAVNQLVATYGARVNTNPDSVEYRVLQTKKHYTHDGMLPRDEQSWVARKLYVVAEGRSNSSMEEALQQSETKSKKVASTVYEQRAEIMVYGHPEASLKLGEEGVAFPLVVTSSKTQPRTQPRAEAGAARDPVAFTSSYALM